jgi:uncharacterized membrane protein
MDLHPIIVHFPVALLSLYALLEIVTVWYRRHEQSVFAIKIFLLVVGWLGGIAGIQSGEIAHELNHPPHDILEMHEAFASATVWIFGLLALMYLAYLLWVKNLWGARVWATQFVSDKPQLASLARFKIRAIRWLFDTRWILALAALAGLMAVSFTGALGGVMVHGTGVDPFADWVITILGL